MKKLPLEKDTTKLSISIKNCPDKQLRIKSDIALFSIKRVYVNKGMINKHKLLITQLQIV